MSIVLFNLLRRRLNTFADLLRQVPDCPQRESALNYFYNILVDLDENVYPDGALESARTIPTTVNVEVEKNTKGFNYKAVVVGAESVERALGMLGDAQNGLAYRYGGDELKAFKQNLKDKTFSLAKGASEDSTLSADAKYQTSVLLLAINEFVDFGDVQ